MIFETPGKEETYHCNNCPGPDPYNSDGLTAGTDMNNAAIVTDYIEENYD